jgi:hypothetical protein
MPNYILEAKKRLGQIKQPHLAPNHQQSSKPSSASTEKEHLRKIVLETNGNESAVSEPGRKSSPLSVTKEKHWLSWEKPETPEKIKQIRKRLGDDRYRKMRSATSSQLELRNKLESINIENNNINVENLNDNSTLKITNTVVLTDDSSNNINNNTNSTSNINIVHEPYKIPDASIELNNKVVVSYPPATTQNELFGILPVEENGDRKENYNSFVTTTVANGKVSPLEKSQFLNDLSIYQPTETVEINNDNRSKSRLLNNYTVNADNNGTMTLESWMQTANEQGNVQFILKLYSFIFHLVSFNAFKIKMLF